MKEAIHESIPDFNRFMSAADTAIMKLPFLTAMRAAIT